MNGWCLVSVYMSHIFLILVFALNSTRCQMKSFFAKWVKSILVNFIYTDEMRVTSND